MAERAVGGHHPPRLGLRAPGLFRRVSILAVLAGAMVVELPPAAAAAVLVLGRILSNIHLCRCPAPFSTPGRLLPAEAVESMRVALLRPSCFGGIGADRISERQPALSVRQIATAHSPPRIWSPTVLPSFRPLGAGSLLSMSQKTYLCSRAGNRLVRTARRLGPLLLCAWLEASVRCWSLLHAALVQLP